MDDETHNAETAAGNGSTLPICPYLALRDDPETRALYPRLDHVCRLPRVYPPSLQWQQRYCIGQHYGLCPHFRVHGKDAPVSPPVAPKRARLTWRRAATAVGALAVLGTGVALSLGTSAAGFGRAGTPGASDSPTAPATSISLPLITPATPVVATLVTPQAAATPAETPAPTPSPTTEPATPAPEPTAAETPAPATPAVTATEPAAPAITPAATQAVPGTYVVAEGDTLSTIATKFNTSVSTLLTLNDISDPDVIHVGTVLKLPQTP